jgi:DNA-binding CsgD family transcriptional regulator
MNESLLPETVVDLAAVTPDGAVGEICIVSRNHFQNQLIKSYLDAKVAEWCTVRATHQWPPVPEDAAAQGTAVLVLWDCFGLSPDEIWVKLSLGGAPDPARCALALFNLSGADPELARDAIARGIRGIFCLDDPPERLARGIEKILDGELWYSRKITSQVLMDSERFRPRMEALEAMLTAREKEILIAIASGAGNNEIADEFRISLHTVKTHLYNIYKKIDVRNRLEATLWVARYL